MNKWPNIGLIVVAVLLVVLFVGLALVTRSQAIDIITHPPEERPPLVERPEDYGIVSEDVTVTTVDGLVLHGWYIPGQNGATSILYAAQNEGIKALATASAFALSQDTVENFIDYELDLPDWITPILVRLIVFWAEREAGMQSEVIDTEAVIDQISPRPVLIIQGGNEDKISPESGQRLYNAAGEPKELWFVPEAGHVNFEKFQPEEYEQRLLDFYDQYLLDQ